MHTIIGRQGRSVGVWVTREEIALLLLILIAAVAVRLAWAPDSLWYDEIASLKFSEQPYTNLWSDWMRRETNPPLYYTALKAWTGLFGSCDAALHGLSIVFGLVGIVAAWALARELSGRRAGFWTAVFTALAPAQVMFSLQVRAYGLAYAAALIALLGAVMVLRDDRATRLRSGLTLYAIGTTVALYAHTTMVLLPLVMNAYALGWFVTRRDHPVRLALPWLATNALVLLLWSWWLSITLWQVHHAANVGWLVRPTPMTAVRWVFDIYVPDSIGPIRLLVALLMTGLAIRGIWLGNRRTTFLLASAAVGGPLVLYLLSFATPVFLPRTVFWTSGPLFVLVGVGVAGLGPRLAAGAGSILAVALGIGCILSHRHATAEPWDALVETIRRSDPQAWVVAGDPGTAFALRYYCTLPECRLRIFTVPIAGETWSADMARPEQHSLRYFGRLAAHHPLFSVIYHERGALTAVVGPAAQSTDLSGTIGLPDGLHLVAWEPVANGMHDDAR